MCFLTHAQSKSQEREEHEHEIQQVLEGCNPSALDSSDGVEFYELNPVLGHDNSNTSSLPAADSFPVKILYQIQIIFHQLLIFLSCDDTIPKQLSQFPHSLMSQQ